MKRLIIIAATVLALVLAATSAASASTTVRGKGTEVIVGSTTNLSNILANAPVLPVKAFGVVRTTGTLSLGGSGNGRGTFYFRAGHLRVKHTQTSGGTQPRLNPKTCVASFSEAGVYTVVAGTGAFHNAKGHGQFAVSFALVFPRLKNGKCNASQSAQPISGKISFLAFGPLSVG
jgi:hypothetical protein